MPKLTPRRALRKGKRQHRHPDRNRRRWTRDQLVRRSGGRCEYCGEQVDFTGTGDRQATIDHVLPRSQGGTDVLANLKLACKACNQDKGAQALAEWLNADDANDDASEVTA